MKKLKNLVLITILMLINNNFIYARTTLAPSATTQDGQLYHYTQTEEKTYTKKTCWRSYAKLKKMLKKDAKEFCGGKLAQTNWSKQGCEKNKVKGHKTKVTVKGTFNAICRY